MANSIVGKLTKTDDIGKRQETFLGLIDKAETFWGNGADKATLDKVREYVKNPENRWVKFVNRVLDETNPTYAKKFLLNLGYEAFFRGTKTIRANREKYNCNIPWLILFDPTDACNMHCVGCWSGTYGHKNNMSYEDMDKIVTQGKELGTYLYFMTGGEPTVRKNDILKLAEKHNDCMFGLFSNSTLIDEELCKKIVELGNITFLLSIEGTPETNDGRRGDGHYAAVMKAMDLLKQYGIIFGTSICYTRANVEAVTDEKFLRFIADKGARFGFYFHYMPVGHWNRGKKLLRRFAGFVPETMISDFSQWTSRMMENLLADVSLVDVTTSILMHRETQNRAYLSISRIRISMISQSLRCCRAHCLRHIMKDSHLTETTCVHVRCLRIQSS